MIKADCHIHTSLSEDSQSPMEAMIEQGIRLGLEVMCITEHMDKNFPGGGPGYFEADMEAYREKYLECREKYSTQMELNFGVELGLAPDLAGWQQEFVSSHPFDFVIGSSHLVGGADPYYPEYYEKYGEEGGYRKYFESILENLEAFSDFDTYGHLDYAVRYGPHKNRDYSYGKYQDLLDEILKKLIEKNIALELNTGGYKYGLKEPNPSVEILSRYRQLGGREVTVGSDAHSPAELAYEFGKAEEVLKHCGFTGYTYFGQRKSRHREF